MPARSRISSASDPPACPPASKNPSCCQHDCQTHRLKADPPANPSISCSTYAAKEAVDELCTAPEPAHEAACAGCRGQGRAFAQCKDPLGTLAALCDGGHVQGAGEGCLGRLLERACRLSGV